MAHSVVIHNLQNREKDVRLPLRSQVQEEGKGFTCRRRTCQIRGTNATNLFDHFKNAQDAKETKEESVVQEEGKKKTDKVKPKHEKRKRWASLLALLGLTFGGSVLLSILIKGFRILSGTESTLYKCVRLQFSRRTSSAPTSPTPHECPRTL